MGRVDDEHGGTPASARRNLELPRYVAGHLCASVAEWALLIAVLVYAYERHGARATGLASLAAMAPYVLLSSATARLAQRHPPAKVRVIGFAAGSTGCAIAATCAFLNGPLVVVVLGAIVMFTADTAQRPVGAVLVPAIVRTSRELITANVWVGHCDNASVLIGPLVATGLLRIGGPGSVMAGCALLNAVAGVTAIPTIRHGPPPTAPDAGVVAPSGAAPRLRMLRAATSPFHDLARVGRRPGALGVLSIETGEFVLVGSLDILMVVIAGEHLDLGDAGAGILGSLFGVGAFASGIVTGHVARRPRLAPFMVASMAVLGAGCLVLGASISLVGACVVLPLLGVSQSVLNLLVRVLLQRSAPPADLPIVFGALETTAGIGLLGGSLLTQVLIAIDGVGTALVGIGGVFVVLAVAVARPLRAADDGADVPVVAMSLLRRLPVFEPMPTVQLEAVARGAVELPVAAGHVVIREGERGDRFYAVADGAFDVSMSGAHVRTIRRGGGFGEVALLADMPRTATVAAAGPGALLAVERVPFLIAVTGHDASRQAAWGVLRRLQFDGDVPEPGPGDGERIGDP